MITDRPRSRAPNIRGVEQLFSVLQETTGRGTTSVPSCGLFYPSRRARGAPARDCTSRTRSACRESARGTLIGYATQPGNVADDGDGRNSPFTGALLAHIVTPGLSVNDLLTAVTDAVVTDTDGRQQPWTHSSLRKQFYFKPPPEQEPAPPAAEAQAAP